MYKYYVPYMHSSGNGYCELIRGKEIDSFKDIKEIIQLIEKDGSIKETVILNYILLSFENDKAVNKDE